MKTALCDAGSQVKPRCPACSGSLLEVEFSSSHLADHGFSTPDHYIESASLPYRVINHLPDLNSAFPVLSILS